MKLRTARTLAPYLVAGALTAALAAGIMATDADRFVTVNPSITQRFADIPSESTLNDFCYRLSEINGVTGVSYRDYDQVRRIALITVFYNPVSTTPRNIRIYMEHSYVLWAKPLST